jgi:hypothetical protein
MSFQRIAKRSIYGTGFVVFWGGIAALVTTAAVRTGPLAMPSPSPEAELQALIVEKTAKIKQEGRVDHVIILKNPNTRAGVKEYKIAVQVFDKADNLSDERIETTYILPGALQYAALLDIKVPEGGHYDVALPPNEVFVKLPENLPLPDFSTFFLPERKRTNPEDGTVVEEQKGIVTNQGTLDYQRAEVVALALDSNDDIIGVGKTFVGQLRAGEQREFTVRWPRPTKETAQVVGITTTNIFLDENVLQLMGDPALLR